MKDKKLIRSQAIARAKESLSKLSIISKNVRMVNQKINSISSSPPEIDDNRSVTCSAISAPLPDIETFHEKYQLGKKIGQGSSGVVWECWHLKRNKMYACKTIMFDDEQVPLLKSNFSHVRQLNHPSIVKYKALYLDLQKHLAYLVMQYVELPSLMKYISDLNHQDSEQKNQHTHTLKSRHSRQKHPDSRPRFPQASPPPKIYQKQIKWIFQQLFKSLRFMHSKGISHRDIKPDNIMVNVHEKQIKIIDFGIAKKMIVRKQKIDMLTITGTLFFRAPEMFLGGGYSEKVDVWAAGITLYEVLQGRTPFASEYISETIENIQNMEIENDESLNFLTKDLLCRLLRKNPSQRFSAGQALQHLWFEKNKLQLQNQRNSDIGHVVETEYSKCKKVVQEYDPNLIQNCMKSSRIRSVESLNYHKLEVDDF